MHETKQGLPLEIKVDIKAYNQELEYVKSRASVNSGVFTSFAPGDNLGIFVLDENGNLVEDNLKYEVQRTGHAYRVDENGQVIASRIYYHSNYTYFAYAPYDEMYTGCLSIDDIIAKYKSVYAVKYKDQHTKEQYNAADLLVCSLPQATETVLRLSFLHAMSLLKVYYNGEDSELNITNPVSKSMMYKSESSPVYNYIVIPQSGMDVYGEVYTTQQDDSTSWPVYSFWQTRLDTLPPNGSMYITISSQPTVSYMSVGVDMGFPSGTIWAMHNLGTESEKNQQNRGGKWYDQDGNVKESLMKSPLHSSFDRGDYYSWGELHTKYEQPAILRGQDGRIQSVGNAYSVNSSGVQTVTPLMAGSQKGYYPATYFDPTYSIADLDGNIAGTEYDVVRSVLWKGEWRVPNEEEVSELMSNSDISVYDWYYEDNIRYAPWLKDTANLHPGNAEYYGTDAVRPYRYLVVIYKFTSKINGEVLYIPGGTWSDWSIDMLANVPRDGNGNMTATSVREDYGGMYYFASSASHDYHNCSSYMELEVRHVYDDAGQLVNLIPVKKKSSYVNHEGETIWLDGLTQNGHRYTGMLIRPVYGGKNWNINQKSRSFIHINVEKR